MVGVTFKIMFLKVQ